MSKPMRLWTTTELRLLRQTTGYGAAMALAKRLGRTPESIRSRRYKLKVKP